MITFNIYPEFFSFKIFEQLLETRPPVSIKDVRGELYVCYIRGIQNGWLILDKGGDDTFRIAIRDIVRVNVVQPNAS